jgi:ketosteroid isomerase-like protein
MSALTTNRPPHLPGPHGVRWPSRVAAAVLAVAACAPALARNDSPPLDATVATAQARRAVDAYLALWSADSPPAATPWFSDRLVLAYDHASPRLQGEVRGSAQAVRVVQTVARLGQQWQFRDLRLFPTQQRNLYMVQYTASGTSVVDGSRLEQNVVLSVELDGRQLVRLTEFTNPALAGASRLAPALAQ